MLQAELCSTLKRRQNGQNKKPNYVMPKNTTINAIYNQLNVKTVEKAMASEGESTSEKYTNGSSSKVPTLQPERATTLPRLKTNTPADTDKPKLMISHGRPNFVRPEPKTAVPSQPTISPEPKKPNLGLAINDNEAVKTGRLKSISTAVVVPTNNHVEDSTSERSQQPNFHKTSPTCFTGHNKITVTNGLNYFETVQPANISKSSEKDDTAKYTNGASTVKTNGAQYKNSTAKSFVQLSQSTPTSGRSSPILSSASPLTSRKVLGFKKQGTLTQSSTSVLKTAEKSSITLSACDEQNEIQRKLQSLKTFDMHESSSPATTRKWTAQKIYGSQSPPLMNTTASPLPPRKVQFKVQTQPQSPHITSPAIHHLAQHGSPNFDVKPIVSFSKDLCVTNRYPDQVKVLRSASPSPEAVSVSISSETNTYFSDLKFTINENGEVIHSSQQFH